MRVLLIAAAVTGVSAALLLATSAPLPMVWDEGDTIARAEAIAHLADHAEEGDTRPFTARLRDPAAWPYTTRREGHPPLAGIVIALGRRWAPAWLDPLARFRLGPIVLFAVAAGAMFYRLERDYRAWPVAAIAVWALVAMPRLFAHAHFATLDGTLTACWVLAWAAFVPACRDWRWIPAFGVALGLTLAAKFTGWLAPLPFAAWALFYRDRRAVAAVAGGVAIGVAVFVALNPPLWTDPIDGIRAFFDLNLHRDRAGLNISTQFFGRLYNLDFPLPWYNTLVWTAITVSPLCLLFGGLGIVASLRRWRSDRLSLLLVMQWATLMVVRALPQAPPHDAVRLFLPSFAFFAALVGVGAGRALYRDSLLDSQRIIAQGWAKAAIALMLAAATFDAVRYYPHGLSYYSRLVGGLRGATFLGMEPTYYWDALDRETLAWLNAHTGPNENLLIATYPHSNLRLLWRWGLLNRPADAEAPPRWYVLQRRPSSHRAADRWLIEHEQPAFERTFAGVPLLDVYSFEQYQRSQHATE